MGELFDEMTGFRRYDARLGRIEGVEVFRVGTWNGDRYDARDLVAMVEAFGEVGFEVPVKLGHREKSGERAQGWVANLRRTGDKLMADLVDVPGDVIATIRERGFKHVSAEIYWNLKRNGRAFKRVLKAVALLGAETPAVSHLRPLPMPTDVSAMALRTYVFDDFQKEGAQMEPIRTTAAMGVELDRLAKRRMLDKGEDYLTAFAAVKADPDNAELVRAYAERRADGELRRYSDDRSELVAY